MTIYFILPVAILFAYISKTTSFSLAALSIRNVLTLLKPMGVTSSASRTLASAATTAGKYPVFGDDSLMSPKSHGTCARPVMKNLRWNLDYDTADKICCYNRHYAEYSGYWLTTSFLQQVIRLCVFS